MKKPFVRSLALALLLALTACAASPFDLLTSTDTTITTTTTTTTNAAVEPTAVVVSEALAENTTVVADTDAFTWDDAAVVTVQLNASGDGRCAS